MSNEKLGQGELLSLTQNYIISDNLHYQRHPRSKSFPLKVLFSGSEFKVVFGNTKIHLCVTNQ